MEVLVGGKINMKEVKVYPQFNCDYCKKRAVKHAMVKHEKICYLNPNRECRQRDGRGFEFFLENGHSENCNACKISTEMIELKRQRDKGLEIRDDRF